MKIIDKLIPKLYNKVYSKFERPWEDLLPREGLIGLWEYKDGIVVESIGVSFSGVWPNVTMTITLDAPFYGIEPFVTEGGYLLTDFQINTNNQIFIVNTGTGYNIAIYAVGQDGKSVVAILRYLRQQLSPAIADGEWVIANNYILYTYEATA